MAAAADAPFQLPFPAANVTYSPAAFGQAEWVEWDTLIVTLGANAVVLVSCLLYFGFLRAGDPGYFSSKRRKLPEKTPPDLPSGFFSWIPALILINDDDVLKFGGFDATVLLRFYRMALKVGTSSCLLPLRTQLRPLLTRSSLADMLNIFYLWPGGDYSCKCARWAGIHTELQNFD
jgi:hypothetical protein